MLRYGFSLWSQTQQPDLSQDRICWAQPHLTKCPARTSYIKHSSSAYANSSQFFCQSSDHWLRICHHCSTRHLTKLTDRVSSCKGIMWGDKGCVPPPALLSQRGPRTVDPGAPEHHRIINMRHPCRGCTDDTRLNHSGRPENKLQQPLNLSSCQPHLDWGALNLCLLISRGFIGFHM